MINSAQFSIEENLSKLVIKFLFIIELSMHRACFSDRNSRFKLYFFYYIK